MAPTVESAQIGALESKLEKTLKLKEAPVESYEHLGKVPDEFVVTDEKKIPNRNWGDDDASKPSFEYPTLNLAPVLRFFANQAQPGDEEATQKCTEEMGKACEEWGFFQVVDHGISQELIDQVIKVSNEFFQLPLEEKEKCAVRPGETEGYGRLDFSLKTTGPARTRFWNDVLRHDIRPLPPANRNRIPTKPEAYRGVIEDYTQGMEKILQVVWKCLSVYLGLGPETLFKSQEAEDESHLIIRLNYYPKCNEPEKVLGVGAHKDFGSLTLLLQDEVGGLQVQKRGTTGWLDVPPQAGPNKGSILVNVANQVEIMSNGRLHSVFHRVQVNRNSSRLSVAAFATPGPKCIIKPIEAVLERYGEKAKYTSLLYGEYATNFAKDVGAGISPHARYEINQD
ncbi:unnamed protein product [Calypogeia fissa]